jgi:acid phosphatase
MSHPPASIPEHWMMCESARKFRAAVTSLTEIDNTFITSADESMPFRKTVERRDGSTIFGEW